MSFLSKIPIIGEMIDDGIQATGQTITANALASKAMAEKQQAEADRKESLGYASPTVAYLQQQSQQLQIQQRAIEMNEKLLATIEPVKLEAGRQALALIRGEAAAALKPYQDQRAIAREKLVGTLRNQFGPTAEVNGAGANALRRFDEATAMQTAQLQEHTLNNFMNIAQSAGPDAFAGANQLAGNLRQLQSEGQMKMNALALTPLTAHAGAQYVGSALKGQVLSNFASGGGGKRSADGIGSMFGGGGGGGEAANGFAPEAAPAAGTGDLGASALMLA
jgi:hypothetical protein